MKDADLLKLLFSNVQHVECNKYTGTYIKGSVKLFIRIKVVRFDSDKFMTDFTDNLDRLKLQMYEYHAMKLELDSVLIQLT